MSWYKESKKKEWPESISDEAEKDSGFVEISFRAKSDCIEGLIELLQHCKIIGGWGHSFSIEVDKDNGEHGRTIGFDGDGADRVQDIKLNGKVVTRDFLDLP